MLRLMICALHLLFAVGQGINGQEDAQPVPPISEEEFRASDNITIDHEDRERDPAELGGRFEGDIDMDPAEIINSDSEDRTAKRDRSYQWPGGVIPYVLEYNFSQQERLMIAKAIKIYEKKTCIRIRPRTNEKDYVRLQRVDGCYSTVGRRGGGQTISLAAGCLVLVGSILHEFMHTAGFYHEQSRPDRNEHITVHYEHIQPNMATNFQQYNVDQIDMLHAPYDICSVMHYPADAFSKDGSPTITAIKAPTDCVMGQRNGFSDTDIRKLNTYYKCEGYPQIIQQSCENKNWFWCSWYWLTRQCATSEFQDYIVENCKKSCDLC